MPRYELLPGAKQTVATSCEPEISLAVFICAEVSYSREGSRCITAYELASHGFDIRYPERAGLVFRQETEGCASYERNRTTRQTIAPRVDLDDLSVLNFDQTRIGQCKPESPILVFDTIARCDVCARQAVGLTPRGPITQATDASGEVRAGNAVGLRMSRKPVSHGAADRANGQKLSVRPAHDLVVNQKYQ